MSFVEFLRRVCPVLVMQAYVDRTSCAGYIHYGAVHPFHHAFISQVSNEATGLHLLVGRKICSEWRCIMMDCAGIDPNYRRGSIRSFSSYLLRGAA